MWGGPKTNNNTKPNQERNNSFQYVAKTPQTTGPSPQPSTPPAQKPQKVAATKTAPTQNPEPMPTEGETAVETVTAQQDLSEKVLFTAGYGGFQIAEFIQLLKSNCIETLLDIRISPHSNFTPDYNQAPFKKAIMAAGIDYQHALELGNVFKFGSDDTAGETPYAELIRTGGEVLTRRLRAKLLKNEGRICIMCACKKANDCHRKLVSGYLEDNYQVKVVHLRKGLVVPVDQ